MVQQENNEGPGRIIVYNGVFFALSETFIYRQVKALSSNYSVSLLSREIQNEYLFDIDKFNSNTIGYYTSLKDRAFSAFSRNILKRKMVFSLGQQKWLHNFFEQNQKAIVHAHYGWSGLEILPYLKKNNIPLVVSFHGRDASGELNNLAYKNNLPELFKFASAIVVCSSDMKPRLGLTPFSTKTHVIPYGVDISYFKPDETHKVSSNKIRLLHVGRLTEKKGVPDLIHVFEKVKKLKDNIVLDIIGDGEEMVTCQNLIRDLGLKNSIALRGAQNEESVREFYNDCDIFVLNSRTSSTGDMEGFPNVILEAMSMAKPVISTLHAGIPDAVNHKQTGLLVPEKNNRALMDALIYLINRGDEREEMGLAGRSRVIENFSLTAMQDKLNRVFEEIVTKRI